MTFRSLSPAKAAAAARRVTHQEKTTHADIITPPTDAADFDAPWADSPEDVDERQVVALLPGEPGPAFATTNAAAFYRVTSGTERTGTYTSAALDAGQIARFGTFRWEGETPAGSSTRRASR